MVRRDQSQGSCCGTASRREHDQLRAQTLGSLAGCEAPTKVTGVDASFGLLSQPCPLLSPGRWNNCVSERGCLPSRELRGCPLEKHRQHILQSQNESEQVFNDWGLLWVLDSSARLNSPFSCSNRDIPAEGPRWEESAGGSGGCPSCHLHGSLARS